MANTYLSQLKDIEYELREKNLSGTIRMALEAQAEVLRAKIDKSNGVGSAARVALLKDGAPAVVGQTVYQLSPAWIRSTNSYNRNSEPKLRMPEITPNVIKGINQKREITFDLGDAYNRATYHDAKNYYGSAKNAALHALKEARHKIQSVADELAIQQTNLIYAQEDALKIGEWVASLTTADKV